MDLNGLIKEAKRNGYSNNEVIELLSQKGYDALEIKNILNPPKKVRKKSEKEYQAIDKIKMLFSEPTKFFEKVQEESIKNSLLLFLFVAFIIMLVSAGFLFVLSGISGGRNIGLLNVFPVFSYFIVAIIGVFIYSGIIHITTKIFHGEGNFVDSFNVVAYCLIPGLLVCIIPLIGILGMIYSIVLMVFGVSILHNISKGKAVVAVLMPLIIFFVIILFLVFMLIFALRGIF